MDPRPQVSLIACIFAAAMAANVWVHPRRRAVHRAFATFAANIGLFYASMFAADMTEYAIFPRLKLASAALVPVAAVGFFRAFVNDEEPRLAQLGRAAFVVGGVLTATALSPGYAHPFVAGATFVSAFVLMFAAVGLLYAHRRHSQSRLERARIQYLTLVGAAAATFTLFEYAHLLAFDIPPVGPVMVLVFLYMLSQSILRERLIDLYELSGRLAVLVALSLLLAGTTWLFAYLGGRPQFVHALAASVVVLLLFDPIRARVGNWIRQVFFRERYDLEASMSALRRRLANALQVEEATLLLMEGLEASRRVTHAALYLGDDALRAYRLRAHLGPTPPSRIDAAPARPLLDHLAHGGPLVLEDAERELELRREAHDDREAETLFEIVQAAITMHASVVLPIFGADDQVIGFLTVRDERVRDAFSADEVGLLQGLATQVGIAVENSELYQSMKDRDRLAALGEMAAGLAHEIRNPLGAIKASAQLLSDGDEPAAGSEFLEIIVEETDRLNRVVGSFLDFARPGQTDDRAVDVRPAVDRTMQLLSHELDAAGIHTSVVLADDLPRVKIDIERLRQVLINLVQNAIQAMGEGGRLAISATLHERRDLRGQRRAWVDLRVTDDGPGIADDVRARLFVPFVTTKERGTGLGLAICQRIVHAAGGRIEVRSVVGQGTTFVVSLPADESEPSYSSVASSPSAASMTSSTEPAESPASVGAPSSSAVPSGSREGRRDPKRVGGEVPSG